MNQPLVSVIVPIYNVEQYVERCIRSIVNQTYTNLEILLIDDGSPDRCPTICDMWAQKDSRIKVVHKPNGGLSSARNAGLDICNGDFISFVDSDDWIERDMIQFLLDACIKNGCALAVCGRYVHYEKINKLQIDKCPINNEIIDSKTFTAHMLIGSNCDCSACDKLFHKSLWDSMQFPEGRIYEDVAILYKIVLQTSYVATLNQPLYHYLRHSNSIVSSNVTEKLFDYPLNTRKMLEDIKQNHMELYDYACCTHTKAIIRVLDKISRSDRATYTRYKYEFIKLKNELTSLRNIWNNSPIFSRRDKWQIRLFANGYITRWTGNIKRLVSRMKIKIIFQRVRNYLK